MAEQDKRGSSALEKENSSGHAGKKARANGVVKLEQPDHLGGGEGQEGGEVRSQGGSSSGGGGGVVAVGVPSMEEPQINVTIGLALLHCHACFLPLKPPTFKCEGGHVVCFGCRAGHGEACAGAAAYVQCNDLDAVVGTARVPCPYEPYGCKRSVVYHEAADHQRACPCAPCSCPEPGCAFYTSPAMLLAHFAADHSWPVAEFRYGKPCKLALAIALPPEQQQRQRMHVLVGQDDRAVFLVATCALGAFTAVCVVCLRSAGVAAAAGAARFRCNLWVEVPNNSEHLVRMMTTVRSSDFSGGFDVAAQGMFLPVPPELLSGEAPLLTVRIDRLAARM